MYPENVIRELVANLLIHQDFTITGTGPLVEIFDNRIEFTNPGKPLIHIDRFIDENQSRNQKLAFSMRRVKICEELGSGIDRVISNIELFQLPAPKFEINDIHTKVTVFAYKKLKKMDKQDKIRACYQHACLCYVTNTKMDNSSLKKRFDIDEKNSATASRIISDTLSEKIIKSDDPANNSRKYAKYLPWWA